jgi:hypothetical protein
MAEKGELLFERKTTILNPNRKFEGFAIYTNGIHGYYHKTDKSGNIIHDGNIYFNSKNSFVKVNEYNYYVLSKPKTPNGYRLITNDQKIIFIYTGFLGKEYNLVLKALKECFIDIWDKILDNKILNNDEVFNLHGLC